MDTKKVQELLRQIETAEAKLQELEKSLAELDKRVQAQSDLTLDLKRQLAAELRDVVAPMGGKHPRRAKRATGLSEVLLGFLEDGKTRSVEELRQALVAKGVANANVSLALSYLAKRGLVKRVGRGQYAKA